MSAIFDCLDRHNLHAEARDICDAFGVDLEATVTRSRQHGVTFARHRLWLMLRDKTGMSFPEIAQVFQRDHTTVVVAVASLRPWFQKGAGQ